MDALIIFASAFWLVFFLGLQSLAVNTGHMSLAMLNSLVIGSFNFLLFKKVPNIAEPLLVMAYLSGGPAGIACSMWFHRRVITPWRDGRGR